MWLRVGRELSPLELGLGFCKTMTLGMGGGEGGGGVKAHARRRGRISRSGSRGLEDWKGLQRRGLGLRSGDKVWGWSV